MSEKHRAYPTMREIVDSMVWRARHVETQSLELDAKVVRVYLDIFTKEHGLEATWDEKLKRWHIDIGEDAEVHIYSK